MTDLHSGDLVATFDYLRDPPTDDPSTPMRYDAIKGQETTMRLASVTMPVIDGRGVESEFQLDREGFGLFKHHTSVTDFLDRSQTEGVYGDEAVALIKQITGADACVTLGSNVRFGDNKRGDYAMTADHKPARFPHGDFTDESAASLVERMGVSVEGYSRWAIFNMWRVFSEAPQDFPLAMCDARSVSSDDEDIVQIMLDVPGRDPVRSNTIVYHPNPEHRWVYFSDMTVDEALVFKSYDSDESRPRRVPHTSFANPLAGPDAPSRRSIETRFIAMFK